MRLLSLIKKDLEFNQNLAQLIDVLKNIAISQYHSMERRIQTYDRIFSIIQGLFEILPNKNIQHPLLNLSNRPPGVIAITSDMGLLGALNMQVMYRALQEVRENKARLIIIGDKGKAYAQENNISFVAFEGIKDENRVAQAARLRNYVVQEELNLKLGELKLFYPHATSLMVQRIQAVELLPFVRPEKSQGLLPDEIIMESEIGDIAGYLVFLLLGQKFYEVFGLSRLAEMAARFIHLEDSGHKLEQIEKELRLQYFRQRHELIDRSMRELYTARLAFK